jgi:Ser/Thr protein kinase RdoA (MazF antagonist)
MISIVVISGESMWHVVLTSILMLCYRIPEVVRAVEYLVHAYGQMLFVDGVFHADPHAGNLLLLADGRLGLLDFGQVSFAIWILHMLMDVL